MSSKMGRILSVSSVNQLSLPLLRELKKRLGEADAAAQFAEVAVRDLSGRLQNSPDPKALLRMVSAEQNVKTDYVDLNLARHQLSRLHIIAVSGEFEQFLEDLRDSHPDHQLWTYEPHLEDDDENENEKKEKEEAEEARSASQNYPKLESESP